MMAKLFILAILYCVASAASKASKTIKSKRPYGELNPRDTVGIHMKYKIQVYEFCRRIPECNMCAETHHCGKPALLN